MASCGEILDHAWVESSDRSVKILRKLRVADCKDIRLNKDVSVGRQAAIKASPISSMLHHNEVVMSTKGVRVVSIIDSCSLTVGILKIACCSSIKNFDIDCHACNRGNHRTSDL